MNSSIFCEYRSVHLRPIWSVSMMTPLHMTISVQKGDISDPADVFFPSRKPLISPHVFTSWWWWWWWCEKEKRLVKQQQLGNKQLAESFHSETRKHQRVFLTEAVCLHLNTAYCTSLEWALVWSTVLHKSFNPNSLVWKLHVLCKNICFYCNKARTSPEKSHCHRQTRWPLSVFCLSRTAGRGK